MRIAPPKPPVPQIQPEHDIISINDMEIPAEESMKALGLTVKNWGDFVIAWKFHLHLASGLSVTKAAKEVGIPRRSIYDEYWQILFAKVQTQMVKEWSTGLTGGVNRIFSLWPQMLDRLAFDVMNPATEVKDRTTAMEFLYMAVIAPSGVETKDDSSEREYLDSVPQFNPLAPLQVLDGGVVNINVTIPPAYPRDTVDIEAYHEAPDGDLLLSDPDDKLPEA